MIIALTDDKAATHVYLLLITSVMNQSPIAFGHSFFDIRQTEDLAWRNLLIEKKKCGHVYLDLGQSALSVVDRNFYSTNIALI